MAKQTNYYGTPTPKRPDWTEATVRQAAWEFASDLQRNEADCLAFANGTVRLWQQGQPTAVTHDWPELK